MLNSSKLVMLLIANSSSTRFIAEQHQGAHTLNHAQVATA
jgi:hypothetical protein